MKEIIGIILFIGLILYFYVKHLNYSTLQEKNQSSSKSSSKKIESKALNFSSPIPKGYQIHINKPQIAGLSYRKDDALKWCSAEDQNIILEREPSNQYDSNAIKVIGTSRKEKYFLGYLPKELSEKLVLTNTYDAVMARLNRIYVSENGFIDIQFQIIGPKDIKQKLADYDKEKIKATNDGPADSSQKSYLKFFNLPITRGLKFGDAEKLIVDHKLNASDTEKNEWELFTEIEEQIDDPDYRDEYGIKKISSNILLKAIKELRSEGKSIEDLMDDVDEIFNKVIELHPNLKKNIR